MYSIILSESMGWNATVMKTASSLKAEVHVLRYPIRKHWLECYRNEDGEQPEG